jgi:hypothetical protein
MFETKEEFFEKAELPKDPLPRRRTKSRIEITILVCIVIASRVVRNNESNLTVSAWKSEKLKDLQEWRDDFEIAWAKFKKLGKNPMRF